MQPHFSLLGFVSEAAKSSLSECRSYTFEELKEATNNFDNSAFMGEGSYGKVLSNTSNMQVFMKCRVNIIVVIFCFIKLLNGNRLKKVHI